MNFLRDKLVSSSEFFVLPLDGSRRFFPEQNYSFRRKNSNIFPSNFFNFQIKSGKVNLKFQFFSFGKVSKILAADFHIHKTENDPLELVRVFSRVPEQLISSETSSSSFSQILMYKILSGSIHFLSNSVAPKDSSTSLLSLIHTLQWIKSDEVELHPSFRPMWTDYSATVPYRSFQLTLRLTVNENTDEIHFDGRKIQTSK